MQVARIGAAALMLCGPLALALFVLRPSCEPQLVPPQPQVARHEARTTQQEQFEIMEAETGDRHASMSYRRNLFAFAQVPQPQPGKVVVMPPPATVSMIAMPQRIRHEPEFPYHYIGRFGPEENPIAVFVADGDVLNVRVGESIGGAFRLNKIGIESAEVSSESGTIQRVAIQP